MDSRATKKCITASNTSAVATCRAKTRVRTFINNTTIQSFQGNYATANDYDQEPATRSAYIYENKDHSYTEYHKTVQWTSKSPTTHSLVLVPATHSLLMATHSLTAVTTHYFRSWPLIHTAMATYSLLQILATHTLQWQLTHCHGWPLTHSLIALGHGNSLTALSLMYTNLLLQVLATHSLPWSSTHCLWPLTHCFRSWPLTHCNGNSLTHSLPSAMATHCSQSPGHSLTASGPGHSLTAMATHSLLSVSWPLTHSSRSGAIHSLLSCHQTLSPSQLPPPTVPISAATTHCFHHSCHY